MKDYERETEASTLLQFMEDEWDGKAIINALNPLLKDEDLAALYDKMQKDGVIREPEEPGDDTPEEVKKALEYVREQLEQDELDEIRAQVDRSYRYHMNPSACVTNDSKVIDLLEEYAFDNDLPEGWWENEGDIDDWLLWL